MNSEYFKLQLKKFSPPNLGLAVVTTAKVCKSQMIWIKTKIFTQFWRIKKTFRKNCNVSFLVDFLIEATYRQSKAYLRKNTHTPFNKTIKSQNILLCVHNLSIKKLLYSYCTVFYVKKDHTNILVTNA